MSPKTWIGVGIVLIASALLFDPASSVSEQTSGVIAAVYPRGKVPSASGTVLVRLASGDSVMAEMQFDGTIPSAGTPVSVVVFDSLLLHHRSYVAQAEPRPGGL